MKANRKHLMANDTRAQVGIGTMIVFIATILVAATAAAVLIDTSGKLQERSSSTGNEATSQVASNLVLLQATGQRDSVDDDSLTSLNFTISLAPGASDVDLQELKIRVSNSTKMETFSWHDEPAGDTNFNVSFERDHDTTSPVMTRGDLVNVKLEIGADDGNMPIDERARVTTTFMPEVGSQLDASFTAPNSFGSSTLIVLR